jgi:hypothetical protein
VVNSVRSLSIVLQDDVAFSKQDLNNDQKRDMEDKGSRNVLDELQRILDKITDFSSESGSTSKRLKWELGDRDKLRSRISTNIGLPNAFNGPLSKGPPTSL